MSEADIDLRSVLAVLRRRMRIVLFIFAGFVELAGLVCLLVKPAYRASALIFVDTTGKDLLSPDLQSPSLVSDNARVDSEVEILRSDAVLIEVIGALDLVSDPEFSPDFRPFDRARAALGLGAPPHDGAALQHVLDELRKAVKIERRGLTYVIAVSARSESAQKAARIANTIAGVYIGNQLRDKSGHMRAASRTVEANLAHARAALIEAQARLDRFSRDNRPILVASSPIEQASADPAPDQLASLFELQQSAELAQSQYRTLLARSAQLRVQSELQLSDSRLVSAALPPSEPAFPQPGIMLVLAGFFGAGAGVVFAFLFENLVGGIASEAQLEAVTGRPCLGAVPLEPLVPGTASVAALLVEAPLSPFSEAVRRVRAGSTGTCLPAHVRITGRAVLSSFHLRSMLRARADWRWHWPAPMRPRASAR